MSELQVPLDSQGFLRRECPICEREFKWHHGPTEDMPPDAPQPEEYHCPYCGSSAPRDQWWTKEQVETIHRAAVHEAMPEVEGQLREAFKPLEKSGFIRTDIRTDPVNPPPPLFEPEDMTAVAPPCHPYEPVKIADDWEAPIHCLVCGRAFAVE